MTDSHAGAEDPKHIADQLSEAILSLEQTDYNKVGTADELRTILDAIDDLREICLRHREAQRGRSREPNGRGDPSDG